MADEVCFSEQGCAVTPFEVALVQRCAGDGPWEMVAQGLVRALGPAIAAQALAVVFDELGSEKVHVPRRARFFSGVWVDDRRDWVADRVHVDHWTLEEVAAVLRVEKSRVSQILAEAGRTKLNPVA